MQNDQETHVGTQLAQRATSKDIRYITANRRDGTATTYSLNKWVSYTRV